MVAQVQNVPAEFTSVDMDPPHTGHADAGQPLAAQTQTQKDATPHAQCSRDASDRCDRVDDQNPTTKAARESFDDAALQQSAFQDYGAPYFGVVLSGPNLTIAAAALLVAIVLPAFSGSAQWIDMFALLCLIPACVLAVWAYRKPGKRCDFRQLFVRFWMGWMILLPSSLLIGFALSIGWYVILVISALLSTPGVVAFFCFALCLFTSIAAAEEYLKMAVSRRTDNFGSLPAPELYVLYGSATALGLGTGASYYLVVLLRLLIDPISYLACRGDSSTFGSSNSSFDCGMDASLVMMLVLVAGCICFALPMQLLASYHVGLVMARIELLKEPAEKVRGNYTIACVILFRGLFVTNFIFVLMFTGAGTFALALATLIAYLVFVKGYERNMPRDYLERVGYIHFLGYGTLSQVDDDDQDPVRQTDTPQQPPATETTSVHEI